MGRLSEDLVLNTGFLNLGMKFFGVEMQIRKIIRKKYKIIATKFPILNEIIYSTNAFPLFVPRIPAIGDFNILKKALSGSRLAEDVFGKKVASKGVGMVSDILDRAILRQSDQIFKNFSKYVEICENTDFDLPCYSTKLFYGSILQNQKIIDASLAFGTPCTMTNKSYDYISQVINDVIYLDIPKCSQSDNSLDLMTEEIQKFITKLETLAGPIDEDKVINYTNLTNDIKKLYFEFLDIFKKDDSLPIAPQSFKFMISMLNSIYIDLIAAPKYLYKNFKRLIQDLITRKNEGNGYNASNSLRILLIPSLGGFEHTICDKLAKQDVYLFYFDFLFYNLFNKIETGTDWIKNQAKFCLDFNASWNSFYSVIQEWIKLVKKLEIDGVIFNHVSGCDFLSNAQQQFKTELQKINKPMTTINFSHLGENLQESYNKIDALIKILKN